MIDPKPDLSRAAIMANLDYYVAQSLNASLLYRQSLLGQSRCLDQLSKLNEEISLDIGYIK